ncbi:hypothetical protein SAMN05216321_101157 [Cupriavidus sp. OV038]|uniref:hypothetical protein n=1 Tax=unclassified Cupriavidus TaxID=2640874 RepID=UPI0008F042FC|nr:MULTISPECIES: hypothetical protein [unclassified Cupriavidus]SFB69136.1 hypothetical protein SAMN05216321_101157 [Cupriavidus sp. OV038]SFO58555.1 hypothetical protein SAMN05216322_101157 [Cupriavidus sp. OV096]
MKCLARVIPRAEVDQGITQRDQFNSDEFPIRETLVREPHQNSLDGRSKLFTGPVTTRIRLVEPSADNASYWSELLEPLRPHLAASRLDMTGVELSMPRILLIEDFGTTGLLGDPNDKDELNFSDFWRRFGLSHKKGGAAGRWGLGKLVFSSASSIGTFFGLTIRADDPSGERLLMGQAVLNNHKIGTLNYAPHVFFAVRADDGFQLPSRDPSTIEAFRKAAGITRTKEPGLSIAVLCLREGLEPTKLMPHVITNYFFPILTGRLVVEMGDKKIDSASFAELAESHGGPELADGSLIRFIRLVDAARSIAPGTSLGSDWIKHGVATSLTEAELKHVRSSFGAGELVNVRAPVELRRKDGAILQTYVDAYLQAAPEPSKGQALYVRGDITIPGESRSFRGRKTMAALLASDTSIVEFLGDSENPAHTRWVGSADKLTAKWSRAGEKVSAIKRLLNDLNDIVTEAETQIDEDALIEFFSIPTRVSPDVDIRPKPVPRPSPPPAPPPAKPRAFNVTPRSGGFVIRGNPDAIVPVPYQIRVVAAYGVRRGNPFKRHKPQDFDFRGSGSIAATATGATWHATEPNTILVDVASPDFKFEATGFDTERDLELNVRR